MNGHSTDRTSYIVKNFGKKFNNIRVVDNDTPPGFTNAIKKGFSKVTNRKGWEFLLPAANDIDAQKAIERLEKLRKEGATFFVATVIADFDKSPVFSEYMFRNYRAVEHNKGKFVIFSLSKK